MPSRIEDCELSIWPLNSESDHPAGNFKQVSQFSRALLNFLF